jgi:hypothetical protein
MNEDALFWILPVTILAFSGFLAVLIHTIVYRRQTIICPHCSGRIPTAILTEHLPCPDCQYEPSDASSMAPVETSADMTARPCRICQRTSEKTPMVGLWDGAFYCSDCINSAHPDLVDYARSHRCLAEKMPYSAIGVGGRILVIGGLTVAGFASILALPMICAGQFDALRGLFGVISLSGIPVVVMFSFVTGLTFNRVRPIVNVWDGKLLARSGLHVFVAPLWQCRWFAGRASQMRILPYGIVFRGPALIVELPESAAPEGTRVAVGFNQHSFELWQAFFRLASIEEVKSGK